MADRIKSKFELNLTLNLFMRFNLCMGHFSVFDMFNTCVEDLDSKELDSCIPVDEQPLARRALSMIDTAVCSKAKRKFPKGPPTTIPTTFSYPPSQG